MHGFMVVMLGAIGYLCGKHKANKVKGILS